MTLLDKFLAREPKHLVAAISVALLTGCGGNDASSGGGATVYTSLSDTVATELTTLRFLAVSNAAVATQGVAGELQHPTGIISGGTLSGDLDNARVVISLDGGGTATLTNPDGTTYLRVFSTSGLATDLFGVVGQATASADLPASGTTVYTGSVSVEADTVDGAYVLSGDSKITADWSGDVDTDFLNLTGTLNSFTNVANVATISVENSPRSGNSFDGGTLTTGGAASFSTDGSETVTLDGQFFGPAGDEVGGTLIVTDADLNIIAIFTAD